MPAAMTAKTFNILVTGIFLALYIAAGMAIFSYLSLKGTLP